MLVFASCFRDEEGFLFLRSFPRIRFSFFAEDADGLDARGAIGWDDGGEDADQHEEKSDGGKRERICGADTENEGSDNAAERYRGHEAKRDPHEDGLQSVGEDHANDVAMGSAKGHANADFADAAANGVREHAVNADGSKNQREPGKAGKQQHIETQWRD